MPSMTTRASYYTCGSCKADGLMNVFLRSYSRSNAKFPQTRFYFVIDFSGSLDTADFARVLNEGVSIPDKTVAALVESSNRFHHRHRVARSVTGASIRADIHKMLSALREVYAMYCEGRQFEACLGDFIQDCIQFKAVVDRAKLSPEYLAFVSPDDLRKSVTPKVVRVPNTFLPERVLEAAERPSTLLTALQTEIVRPLWGLRAD
jgi:hypothetical protein